MRVSFKSLSGVDSVKVSLQSGVANVVLKPENTLTLKQIQQAVTKNGFTMKTSVATIAGTLAISGGSTQLKVSGSNDVLTLQPASGAAPLAETLNGKSVLVNGSLPEAEKGGAPSTLIYQTIEAQP